MKQQPIWWPGWMAAVLFCGGAAYLITTLTARFSDLYFSHLWSVVLTLLVCVASTYWLVKYPGQWIQKFVNGEAKQNSESAPLKQRFDYRQEAACASEAGKCKGYARILIFENGIMADGDYDPADLIYGLARIMSENPHFASQVMAATIGFQLFSGGKLNAPRNLMDTMIKSAAESCPCEHCQAARAEISKN